ncbi:hypothetical protein KCU99_g1455, partial [Aureobasidium melanogenum]
MAVQDKSKSAEVALPPIAALFLVVFDRKVGYTIAWKRAIPDLKLDGVVEYKSLPSGLHNCHSDLVYFVHDQYAAISAFANRPAHESERNAHFAAVGLLVPLTYGRLGRSWLHADHLRRLVDNIVDDTDNTNTLQQYWEHNRLLNSDHQSLDHDQRLNRRKSRALSDAAGLHPTNPTLSQDHPAMSLAHHLHVFGPLIFPLQRAALLKKSILIMSSAPVQAACNLVYNLSVLSNIPPSAADLAGKKEALYPLRPLFNVGIHDIDNLSQLATKSKPQNSWIACSTDDILATKSKLYDVLVELPPQTSDTSAARRWPRIRTSTGEDIKATQRDLRRYYTLKRELNRVQHQSQTYSDGEADDSVDDNQSESAPLVPSLQDKNADPDQYIQLEGESKLVEPSSWASIAYTSFLWWASAGEKDTLLNDEACQDARLIDDLPLPAPSKHHPGSGKRRSSAHDESEGINVRSQTVAVILIAYAHRLTTLVMETLTEIVEAADAEAEHGNEGTITIHSEDLRRMGLDEWIHTISTPLTPGPMSSTGTAPPPSTGSTKVDAIKENIKAAAPSNPTGLDLYSRFAFAGAVCCSVTHGGLTPVDVVKTRIQLDPVTYNRGLVGGFRQVIQNEGAGALLTGVGPTFAGYFLQGAFKFGGYEFFKQQAISMVGYENAVQNRTAVYLVSSAFAEFFADIALCPLEATRIRLVSEPTFASGLVSGFSKIAKTEGLGGFYSGFGPMLFKQVPYTMSKFVVYEKVAEAIYKRVDKSTASPGMQTSINLGSGLIAGFAAAIVSQPADTMLSKINKTKGMPGESTTSRLIKIAKELGLRGSYSGIGARLFMVGTITAGQFAIYGDIKKAIGATGGVEIASK